MRLWLDTNFFWRRAEEQAALKALAQNRGVVLACPWQTLLERSRQLRLQSAERASLFVQAVNAIVDEPPVLVLDATVAEAWATLLARRYPTKQQWDHAKVASLGGRLRLDFEQLPAKVPMTTDWLIALAVEAEPGAHIVTDDDGEEWRALRTTTPPRALSYDAAMEWLAALPTATTVPS